MKKDRNFHLMFVIVVLIALNIVQCTSSTKTITVKVPEKKGSFQTDTVIKHVQGKTIYKTKFKDSVIYVENEVNKDLVEQYTELQSEFDRYKLFLDAVKIQSYTNTFEDNYITAEVSGSVQGEVKSMALNYTLKARKVETKIKKKKFGIGMQLGITYMNDEITPYVGLGVSYNLIRF